MRIPKNIFDEKFTEELQVQHCLAALKMAEDAETVTRTGYIFKEPSAPSVEDIERQRAKLTPEETEDDVFSISEASSSDKDASLYDFQRTTPSTTKHTISLYHPVYKNRHFELDVTTDQKTQKRSVKMEWSGFPRGMGRPSERQRIQLAIAMIDALRANGAHTVDLSSLERHFKRSKYDRQTKTPKGMFLKYAKYLLPPYGLSPFLACFQVIHLMKAMKPIWRSSIKSHNTPPMWD